MKQEIMQISYESFLKPVNGIFSMILLTLYGTFSKLNYVPWDFLNDTFRLCMVLFQNWISCFMNYFIILCIWMGLSLNCITYRHYHAFSHRKIPCFRHNITCSWKIAYLALNNNHSLTNTCLSFILNWIVF